MVIGIMAPRTVLASYQVASQFAMIMVVLRSAVINVFENRIPKHRAGEPLPDVTTEFVAATRLLLHLSVPGFIVLACCSGFWVRLLFGAAYGSAALPLVVLVVGQIAATFVGPTTNALHMTGEERNVMWLMIGTAILNIGGNVVLIPYLGATGAALATAVANLMASLVCLVRLVRTGRLRFSFTWLRDIALATALCAISSLLIVNLGHFNLALAIGAVVVSYILYTLCVCLTCTVEDEFVQVTKATLRRSWHRLVAQ